MLFVEQFNSEQCRDVIISKLLQNSMPLKGSEPACSLLFVRAFNEYPNEEAKYFEHNADCLIVV